MRWTQRGAHLLLQTRTKVLNDERKGKFLEWYPKMNEAAEPQFEMVSATRASAHSKPTTRSENRWYRRRPQRKSPEPQQRHRRH